MKTEKEKKKADDAETSYAYDISKSEKENAKSSYKEIMEQFQKMGLYDVKAGKKLY